MSYRPCVGIMLINKQGLVFIGQRIGAGEGGGWQMPQGGIDAGEDPLPAALRELKEETNVTSVSLLKMSDHWYSYDLPESASAFKGKFRGQTQKWVAFRFEGDESEINILAPAGGHRPEFTAWRWEKMSALAGLIIPFKRDVYEKVCDEFALCHR